MNLIPKFIKRKNSAWKVNLIAKYIKDGERLLDFGCGDLMMAKGLKEQFPNLRIVGVDVIDAKSVKGVKFVKYEGRKLPFKKNSFDSLIAFYVYHHCFDVNEVISECGRVAKKLIIVESIPHSKFEIPFMRFFDWFYNIVKFDGTNLPYNFHFLPDWKKMLRKQGFKIVRTIHPSSHEDFFPFGKMYVIIAEKKNIS